MATDYIPRSNMHAYTFCTTLANAMAVEPERFGVGADEVTALQAQIQEFGASLQRIDRMEKERTAEVERRKDLRDGLEATVRDMVRRVQANAAVHEDVKAAAGIRVRDRVRSHLSPLAPTGLVVRPDVSGDNHLAWKTTGQARGTMYRIEARAGAETKFTLVDVIPGSRYVHEGQKPGAPIVYRIRARLSGQLSAPSNEAGIYDDGAA